jgi:hypothetical protein
MLHLWFKGLATVALVMAMVSSAQAVTVYSESINGDLSNNGLNPTVITLAEGSNDIFGTTGRDANAIIDRDYFTASVPSHLKIVLLIEAAGTQSGGPLGIAFIGIQSGTQVTSLTSATDLLGYFHYGPTATDINILPSIGSPAPGAIGFAPPLGPGNYAFWIQETGTGTFPVQYGFKIVLARIPEPAAGLLMFAGLAALWPVVRRRQGMKRKTKY